MKKVILAGLILFYVPGLLFAQPIRGGPTLIQQNELKGGELAGEINIPPKVKAGTAYEETSFFETSYYNLWDFYEKTHNGFQEYVENQLNLPEPLYFKLRKGLKFTYRKDRTLNFCRKKSFVLGFCWFADKRRLKNKKDRKDFKFGFELGINSKEQEILGGFTMKF